MPYNSSNSSETSGSATSIAAFNVALVGTVLNGYAVASLVFSSQAPTGITVTIGGASAVELTGSPVNASGTQVRQYGRAIGDTSGNLSCSASWTTAAVAGMTVVVADGIKQTSSFISPISTAADAGAGSATPTLTVTGGASGDFTVAALALDSGRQPTAPLQTSAYASNVQFQAGMGVSYGARSGGDVTHGWTDSGATSYAFAGVNLIQADGGGGSPSPVIVGKRFRGLIYS